YKKGKSNTNADALSRVEINNINDRSIDLDKSLRSKISFYYGDITDLRVDAIVNAAKHSLLGGGGVDGAIHRKSGPNLKYECRKFNGCKTGDAKITNGYNLPARFVIHTVGPQILRNEHPNLLRNCYKNSFKLMLENEIKSIAFPCIATGLYKFPNDKAAIIALEETKLFLKEHANQVEEIIFCLFKNADREIYENLLNEYFPLNNIELNALNSKDDEDKESIIASPGDIDQVIKDLEISEKELESPLDVDKFFEDLDKSYEQEKRKNPKKINIISDIQIKPPDNVIEISDETPVRETEVEVDREAEETSSVHSSSENPIFEIKITENTLNHYVNQ
ncbi:hypothetical protein EPUL_006796, partial [Erysiphe pulchra]